MTSSLMNATHLATTTGKHTQREITLPFLKLEKLPKRNIANKRCLFVSALPPPVLQLPAQAVLYIKTGKSLQAYILLPKSKSTALSGQHFVQRVGLKDADGKGCVEVEWHGPSGKVALCVCPSWERRMSFPMLGNQPDGFSLPQS